ncbi:MAG: hypothetical protein HYX34_09900, partial [Actinobacteria bacterium]|nr:hypothetical protein [Actinomycetota bacterium]
HYVDGWAGRLAVGGRSLLWHGVCVRIEDWALDSWPAAVRRSLVGTSTDPGLYAAVEADLAAWTGRPLAAPRHDGEAELASALEAAWPSPAGAPGSVGVVPLAARGADAQARSAAPEASSPRVGAGADSAPDVGPGLAGGAERAYTPLRDRPELGSLAAGGSPRLLSGCRAVTLLRPAPGPYGAPGVRLAHVNGTVEDIRARAVIVAAGALETTRLVARLEPSSPIRGLNDHLVQGFVVRLPPGPATAALPPAAFVMRRGSADDRSNVFIRLRPLPAGLGTLLDVWAMGEQWPSEATRVEVVARDGHVQLAIEAGLSDDDREVVALQRRALHDTWRKLADVAQITGAATGAGPARPPAPLVFEGDLLANPRPFGAAAAGAGDLEAGRPVTYSWPLGTVDHEGGTLPLGDRLDEDGGLPDAPGVHVTGPATFPRPGAANPSLTTLALARRTAEAAARRLA